MRQAYIEKRFNRSSLETLQVVNEIINEYDAQGFVLTVRQLYYQLVARDYIANNLKEYKRVASLLNDARLAGLVDWDAIEDRTRAFVRRTRWTSGSQIIEACVSSFHKDMWEGQDTRVFVLVEKEALVGVLEPVCHEYDIPLLAARGYPSVSVIREFVNTDLSSTTFGRQDALILHLGDHDPSGIDMTRDLQDRIALFAEQDCDSDFDITVKRIALNIAQVEELKPPENPAKTTDARFEAYRRRFGSSSWELDALSPEYLASLVRREAERVIDTREWSKRKAEIDYTKERLSEVAENFAD